MLETSVKRTIIKHSMLSAGGGVLVCLSGGADSVCLLEILDALKGDFGISLSVCHMNHMLRGAESRRDAEFSEELARRKNLPFFRASKNVRLKAGRKGISIEEAAREIRYDFFIKTAVKAGSACIATGHNRDDLAETVLLNLMRGTGPRGLAGIPPFRAAGKSGIRIIRPLIETPRREIHAFLDSRKIPRVEDSSNRDAAFSRNRVRLEVIPFLEASFGPGIKERLARTASLMSEFNSYLSLKAEEDSEGVFIKEGLAPVEISVEGLRNLHPAAREFVLQKAFSAARGHEQQLSSAKIRMLMNITEGDAPNRSVNLPGGLSAAREYGRMVIGKAGQRPPVSRRILNIPGTTRVPEAGADIATAVEEPVRPFAPPSGAAALLDLDKITLPAAVRTRKTGDRFSPVGMKGTKKLKDFMMDRKMPLAERNNLLVIVDSLDRPVCLLEPQKQRGHTGEGFKITPGTRRVLQVRIV